MKGTRVYYIPFLVIAALLGSGAAQAQVELTVMPAMTRGPLDTSTPTFLVNGRVLVGAHGMETFRSAVPCAGAERDQAWRS